MFTYNLKISESLMNGAKSSFPTQAAATTWMQQQIERMLRRIAVADTTEVKTLKKVNVSDKVKALSAVPASASHADYKDEMPDLLGRKY